MKNNTNKNRKIFFITTNKHKFQEVRKILLDEFGIKIRRLTFEYDEGKEAQMKGVCLVAAKNLAEKLNKKIFVEDTGLFFEVYHNFPGPMPKFVINGIGFNGIFRLLAGKSRKAYFKTVIGYCEPGKKPITFEGVMRGKIIDKIIQPKKESMPYDHIFIPDGYRKTIVEMPINMKNSFSQRGKATRKLGKYLKQHLMKK